MVRNGGELWGNDGNGGDWWGMKRIVGDWFLVVWNGGE